MSSSRHPIRFQSAVEYCLPSSVLQVQSLTDSRLPLRHDNEV